MTHRRGEPFPGGHKQCNALGRSGEASPALVAVADDQIMLAVCRSLSSSSSSRSSSQSVVPMYLHVVVVESGVGQWVDLDSTGRRSHGMSEVASCRRGFVDVDAERISRTCQERQTLGCLGSKDRGSSFACRCRGVFPTDDPWHTQCHIVMIFLLQVVLHVT